MPIGELEHIIDKPEIQLIDQSVTPQDTATLMKALKNNTTVTTLNLYQNNLGAEGARILAEGLNDTCITSLDVGCNHIGNEGVQSLAEMIRTNTSLTSLTLYCNNINSIGMESLTKAMQQNFFILSINLGWFGNDISRASLVTLNADLEKIFNRNKGLRDSKEIKAYQTALKLVQKAAATETIIEAFLFAQNATPKESKDLLSCIEAHLTFYQARKERDHESKEREKSSKSSPPKSSPRSSPPQGRRRISLLTWMTTSPKEMPQPKEGNVSPLTSTSEVTPKVSP